MAMLAAQVPNVINPQMIADRPSASAILAMAPMAAMAIAISMILLSSTV